MYTSFGFLSIRVQTGEQSHYATGFITGIGPYMTVGEVKVHDGDVGGRQESLISQLRSQGHYFGLSKWALCANKCPCKREMEGDLTIIVANVMTVGAK